MQTVNQRIRLNFKINRLYLLIHSLSTSQPKPFSQWATLQNYLWSKYPLAFHSIAGPFDSRYAEIKALEDKIPKKFTSGLTREINKMIKDGLKSREFRRLERETRKYLRIVRNQWKNKQKNALQELEDIIGFNLPEKTINVYITHPKLRNGMNIPELDIICWGHPEDWKNYTTVYLCHELMHIITHKKYKNENIIHAIIEMATDNELRIRLNGKGVYFVENNKPIGHQSLQKTEEKMLPLWKKYLKNQSPSNIFDLERLYLKKKRLPKR